MLALKLGLSLVSTRKLGEWTPIDVDSLEGWYQNKIGITLNGSDVSTWEDSSTNSYDMVQADATEQPAYDASTGALTFVVTDKNNLQTTGQISLAADFTIGVKINPALAAAGSFLADNTSGGELFKYTNATTISIKIGGGAIALALDSGSFGDDYLVFTRVSGVLTLWQNGVAQSGTQTLAGTSLIDTIGIRKTNVNGFSGTIKEVQIYSSSDADLTANVNNRLSTL